MDLAARHRASQRQFLKRFGGYVVEPYGSVLAAVTPAAPDRSIPNSIVYEDPYDVLPALAELEGVYRRERINAWTVWVQPGDEDLARRLWDVDHAPDGSPARMGAEIDALTLAEPPARMEAVSDWRVVGEVNDAARGADGLAATLGAYRADDSHGWLALDDDGRPLATAAVNEHEGDAFVFFAATLPEARGRGLCRGLVSHALRVAREHGCTTTTLKGSPMGEPIYAGMGYETLGRLQLWERRLRDDSA